MVIRPADTLPEASPLTKFFIMKQIFTSIALIFIAIQLQAQITIERSDYTLEFDAPIVRIVADNPAELTIPEAGEDMLWDYTAISFPTSNVNTIAGLEETSAPEMPDANIAFSFLNTGLFLPGLFFESKNYQILDEEGYRLVGRSHEPTDYPIGAITGTPTDSINFLYVLDDLQDPLIYVEFPINYGNSDINHFNTNNDLLLTATPFGLDHVPGNIQFQYQQELTVDGWGSVQVTNPLDGEVVEIEVLMIKEIQIRTDSAFLGGGPAPQSLLDNFGLIQGNVVTAIENYEFWAKGLDYPVMRIEVFADGTYSGFLNANASSLVGTSDKIAAELIPVAVAPNPSDGHFQMNFIKNNAADWTLEIHDFIGRIIHQQTITGAQGAVNEPVSVNVNVNASGTHVYLLRNEVGKIMGTGKVLLR